MKIGSTKLPIGDAFQPHLLLKSHDFGNGFVFDLAQGLGGERALGMLLARLKQISGAQKAAHVVVACRE